jgi:transposase InsO family protein
MIALVAQQTGGSIRQVCAVLGEARSSFYHASTPTATQVADVGLGELIETVFRRHRRRYGYRRVAEELSDRGVTCAPARTRRLMAQRGLRALQPKNFLPKTSDGRADKPSPNLLSGQPLPEAPDRAWAGDITFIHTSAGWLYLAVVIDLCSRRIVGWSLADHLRSDLVLDALDQALQTRPVDRAIFHSDRGSCSKVDASRTPATHVPKSSNTSKVTTTPTANTPRSVTKPRSSSRPNSTQ